MPVEVKSKPAAGARKTVVFSPVNCRGHINMMLDYADLLKEDYDYRTIFLLLGPTIGTNIEPKGHELVIVRPNGDSRGLTVEKREEKYTSFNEHNEVIHRVNVAGMDVKEVARELMFGDAGLNGSDKREWLKYHANYERVLYSLKPDLVVFDTIHLPPCASTLTIPWVLNMSTSPTQLLQPAAPITPMPWLGCSILTKEKRLKMQREEPEKWQAMLKDWESLQDITYPKGMNPEWEELCRKHNHIDWHVYRNHSPYLNVYIYPREFDYDVDDDLFYYPSKWFRCDSLYRRKVPATKMDLVWANKLEEAMRERPQMVYFSLGTLASAHTETINKYVEIFASDPNRLYVVSKGVIGDKVKLDAPNVIGDNYLPQALILRHATVAIIHGGNNSFIECAYYGVPMIVTPCFGDQFDNAARLEDLEVGKRLDLFKPDRQKLLAAIDELSSNQSLRKKVKRISESLQSRDSRRKLSMMLRKLIEERKLDRAFVEECRQKEVGEINFECSL